jgi:intracellular sulfur oxidation DsrE/DsrF family protein
MKRRFLSRSAGGVLLAAAVARASGARAQVAHPHRIAVHVGGADPVMMNIALNNITAAAEYYAGKNEAVAIELVANGPGYTMLRADTSPVKAHIAEVHARFPFVVFSACQRSRSAAAKAEGKTAQEIPEVPEATDVLAGIVRLSELQEQGWSYIRV